MTLDAFCPSLASKASREKRKGPRLPAESSMHSMLASHLRHTGSKAALTRPCLSDSGRVILVSTLSHSRLAQTITYNTANVNSLPMKRSPVSLCLPKTLNKKKPVPIQFRLLFTYHFLNCDVGEIRGLHQDTLNRRDMSANMLQTGQFQSHTKIAGIPGSADRE